MSETRPAESSSRTPEHALTYGELETRLNRLERLENGQADVGSAPSNASSDPSDPLTTTSVVFSDEVS